jgi:predicted O-linked N-acetylglucosamine transferase (SPINDLY family)
LEYKGELDQAASYFRRALAIQPNHTESLINLGNVYLAMGQPNESLRYYQRVLSIHPDSAEAHCNLGNAFRQLNQPTEAAAHYRQAVGIAPNLSEAHYNLGVVLESLGSLDESRAHYGAYLRLKPDRPLRELRMLTMCPAVFGSNGEIDEYREQLLTGIRGFRHRNLQADPSNVAADLSAPPFNLPYQGRDDLPIKMAYANLIERLLPRDLVARTADGRRLRPATKRLRIGFVVTNRHQQAFTSCMGGILERLDRSAFEIMVVCPTHAAGLIRRGIRSDGVEVVPVANRFDQFVAAIDSQAFDLLYYWEVGTDTTNYLLPFLRLAPVQCTSWGFPVTTGIANVDIYLSSDILEASDGQRDYTERLVLMDTLPTYQRRRMLPQTPKGREDFGLPKDRHIYFCAQNLGKLHPDFDFILAGILRRDKMATIVFIQDQHGHGANRLRARFAAAMPDVAERMAFLPRCSHADYLSLIDASDVLLDTPHYCGVTTTYDALSLGKPVVTLPGRFQRSRYTAACYEKMGWLECVALGADDYIDRAVMLGTEPDLRSQVRAEICERSELIFEDQGAIQGHERVFRELASPVQATV